MSSGDVVSGKRGTFDQTSGKSSFVSIWENATPWRLGLWLKSDPELSKMLSEAILALVKSYSVCGWMIDTRHSRVQEMANLHWDLWDLPKAQFIEDLSDSITHFALLENPEGARRIGEGSSIAARTLALTPGNDSHHEQRLIDMKRKQEEERQEIEHRFASLESVIQSMSQKIDSMAGKITSMTLQESGSTEQATDIEEEINRILEKGNYRELYVLLERDAEKVVDIFCRKTAEGVISLDSEKGKQAWRHVISFYLESKKDVDSIYSKLAYCSMPERKRRFHAFIYDAIFAVNGGVNASFDAGYWAADKYAKRVLRKKVIEVRELLEQGVQ